MASGAFAEDELVALLSEFHRHPELSFEEHETSERIRGVLSGIEGVELLDVGTPTGVLARVVGGYPGPTVGLRADIDALPVSEDSDVAWPSEERGRMHACGHDFHLTALLGAASLLAARRDELSGSVVLLFQPAEESSFGARRVIEAGSLQRLGVQRLFGLHVAPALASGTVAVGDGAMSAAVDRFVITVRGRGGHAAHPDEVLDPIVAASRLVGSLQEVASRVASPFAPVVLSVTRIEGGTTWNVIPDAVELEGTARTFSAELRDEVERQVRARVAALEPLGYEASVDWRRSCSSVVNDSELAGLYRSSALAAGFSLVEAVPAMGGEDFAEYGALMPTAFANVGVGCPWPLHSPHFRVDPAVLGRAAQMLANVAVRALELG